MKVKKKQPVVYVNIILLSIYCFLTICPIWYILNNAVKKPEYIYKTPFILSRDSFTLQSLIKAFRLMKYPVAISNNIVILAISMTLIIVIGSLAAYGITISKSKISSIIYVFIVLLITVPFQFIMISLVGILRRMGLLGNYLGTSAVYTVMSMPLVVFLYTGYMKTIPIDLAEASIVDGCSLFKTYLIIYMPLIKVVTITVFIVRGVFIWNDLIIALITITNPTRATLVLRLYTFLGQRLSEWDMICAGAFLVSLPLALVFLLFQKYFVRGVTAGSIKG